jgi:hypothetical protein
MLLVLLTVWYPGAAVAVQASHGFAKGRNEKKDTSGVLN